MSETELNNTLHIPSRQSPIAIFLIVQNLLRQLVRQFWPILLVIVLNYFNFQAKSSNEYDNPYLTNVLFALAAFSTIGSIIAYFKFYYFIEDGEFVIQKGLFQKKRINIPFDRIQTINFEQNLIHQAFNVVRLEIDSAGSNQKEITIQAIRKEKAEAIRSFIISEKAKIQPSDSNQQSIVEEPSEHQELLLNLSPLDLLKVGVSQNHLRGLGIIIGFGFWIFQSIEDFLPDYRAGENPVEYLERDLGLGTLISFWIYFILILIILSILISLSVTVFRHYDLKFLKTAKGFKVISGLFTKREASANINKIQFIRWEDSLLQRLFSIFRLHLFQASSAAINIRQSINIPGCYNKQIEQVRKTYFPNEHQFSYNTHQISPLIIRRRLLYLGGIPALLIVGWAIVNKIFLASLWAVAWLLFVYINSRILHKNWKFHISEAGLLTEHGILGTNFTLLKWYKIQAVRTRQSLYQRRKNLADIYFYTAAGAVKIPYVPLEKAEAITNYTLYKVEVEQKDWM